MSTIYSPSAEVDMLRMCMKTEFNKKLIEQVSKGALDGRVFTCSPKALPINTGGQVINGTNVTDICQLRPFFTLSGIDSMGVEIAFMNYTMQSYYQQDWAFVQGNMPYSLFYDYMLSNCLCLVEIFDGHQQSRAEKFFATRNAQLACELSGDDFHKNMNRYENALYMSKADFEYASFKMLKVSLTKGESFKVTVPKKSVDLSGIVKVTPVFFLTELLEGLQHFIGEQMVRIKYIKDNLTVRTMETTLNTLELKKYYPYTQVKKMLEGVRVDLSRGYVRLPELGLSIHDETGVRALNLSRIIEVEPITAFDTRFLQVDFERIAPSIRRGIEKIGVPNILKQLYYDLVGRQPQEMDFYSLRTTLLNHVDVQILKGSTTTLRALHLFMLQRPDIFVGYTGLKEEKVDFGLTGVLGYIPPNQR